MAAKTKASKQSTARKSNKVTVAQQAPVKKLSASQRIEMLEKLALQSNERFNLLADEIDKLRQINQALNSRLAASIEATDSEGAVKDIIINQNLKELKGKVDFLTGRGVLVINDDMTVVDKSFIVGRDISEDGKVANPRVQFSVESLPKELKDTVIGKKLGDMIKPEGAETSLEILEIYEVHEVDSNQQFSEAAPVSTAAPQKEVSVED